MSKKYFIKASIKKYICLLLILCLSVSAFTGCGKDKKKAGNIGAEENSTSAAENIIADTFDDNADAESVQDLEILHPVIATKEIYTSKPNDSDPYIRIKWNTVTLSDEEAEKYPGLAKILNDYSNEQDEYANNFNDESRDEAYEYYDDIEAELIADDALTDDWYLRQEEWPFYLNFTHEDYLNIVRCDEIAFTVQEDFSNYMGGAHGYYAYYGTNFDTQTGNKLMVEDVVKDIDKLNSILHDKLMAEYEDLELDDDTVWEDLKSRASGEYKYAWLLSHDKVTFYFNPYELTAYAGGMQVIDIFFSEYPELFEEKYTRAASEYVIHLGKSGEIVFDINDDGKKENVSAYVVEQNSFYPEETSAYRSTISITIDDETENFSVPDGYDGDIYFVHTINGNYIYFNTKIYDYSSLMCIDISDGYAKRVHRERKFEPYLYDENFGGEDLRYAMNESRVEKYREAFTDPDCLTMSLGDKRVKYYVGDDGFLEKEGAEEKSTSGIIKAAAPNTNINYAGTYWNAVYIEEFSDLMAEDERFTDYDYGGHVDLFVYEDGTALLRSIDDYEYEAYSCKGSWKSDNRGGIIFEDCLDPDGYERDYYDSYLIPHFYPADIEINGEKGLLAMEFYDKCLYFIQAEMPDMEYEFYSGMDLSNSKKVKNVIAEDNLSGEWVINSIRMGDTWITTKNTDVVCTVTIWDDRADFYYYSENGLQEQFYGMKLDYEPENFSDENTKGYTLYAYPNDGTYENDYSFVYFRIAPFGKSLMVQKLAESLNEDTATDVIYYFYRSED